jgi:hypothetical protein
MLNLYFLFTFFFFNPSFCVFMFHRVLPNLTRESQYKKLVCLNSTTVLSITSFSIMTLSITIDKMQHSAKWQIAVMLNFIMLKVIMLNVAMPSVIRLYVFLLSVVAPFKWPCLVFLVQSYIWWVYHK